MAERGKSRKFLAVVAMGVTMMACGGPGTSSLDGTAAAAADLRRARMTVTVSPASASLATGTTETFLATVSGATNTAVTWSIQEGAAGGTIDATGLYTAPATAGIYHVIATSQANAYKSATATVTVTAPGTTATPPTTTTTTTTSTSGTWISAYYPGYQSKLYPPSAVDFSAITHLFMAAAVPHSNATLDTTFYIDSVNGPALAQQMSGLAHAAGRKAILMVGGAGTQSGWEGATSSANLSTFVQNLLSTMQSLGYDGLDLDWEPFSDTDKPLLIALAQGLRAASPNIILTVPIGWVNSNFGADPWYAQLVPYFDQINIMTYGMAGNWPGWLSWHQAALAGEAGSYPSSVSSSANAYAAIGIPRSKIGIGIAFAGACWSGPNAPKQGTGNGVVAGDNVMNYPNIMASYYTSAAYHWDSAASAGYLSFASPTGPQGCTMVSYEDDASIQAKGAWVRGNGFGGTIIWTVNEGYVASSGTNPPLSSVKAAFLQ